MSYAYLAALGWEARPLIYTLELLTQGNPQSKISRAYIILTPIENSYYIGRLMQARIEVERILKHKGIKTVNIEFKDPYDIPSMIISLVKLLRELNQRGYKTFVNITTGRKTVSLAIYLASCFQANAIERIVYLSEEGQKLINVPYTLMSISLCKEERRVLQVLSEDALQTIDELYRKTRTPKYRLYRIINRLANRILLHKIRTGRYLFIRRTEMGNVALKLD